MGPSKDIPAEQRLALRQYFQSQLRRNRLKPTQRQLIEWFEQSYSRKISQSAVSESLSTNYAYLDKPNANVTPSRVPTGQWPDLERILFTWQTKIEEAGGFTAGPLIKEKAKQIWGQLPVENGSPSVVLSEPVCFLRLLPLSFFQNTPA